MVGVADLTAHFALYTEAQPRLSEYRQERFKRLKGLKITNE